MQLLLNPQTSPARPAMARMTGVGRLSLGSHPRSVNGQRSGCFRKLTSAMSASASKGQRSASLSDEVSDDFPIVKHDFGEGCERGQ